MPVPPPRLTYPTAIVLFGVARGLRFGFDIVEASGLPSGTVYPILRRLEEAGLLKSRWENEAHAKSERRPARRIYTVTPSGGAAIKRAADRFPGLERIFGPEGDTPIPVGS